MHQIVVSWGISKIQGQVHQMKRSEAILLVLVAFFVLWVFTCVAHPFIGLVIFCGVFVVLLGFFFFVLVALKLSKSQI